jgi:hypothetical protein
VNRHARLTAVVWLPALSAFLVWNGIFGLHVSRGEQRYLVAQARHELGLQAPPSMSAVMAEAVQTGVRQAWWWALVTGALTMTTGIVASRSVRRSEPESDVDDDLT